MAGLQREESLAASRVIYIEQGLSADFLLFRAAISGDPGDPHTVIPHTIDCV